MQFIDDRKAAKLLAYAPLIDALANGFREGAEVPQRTAHRLADDVMPPTQLLLMPAWQQRGKIAIKIVTVHPTNAEQGLPSVHATVLLLDAATGVPELVLEGTELTRRRTAAASALAARYLARSDARTLLMVGAGNLAPHLVEAHCVNRRIEQVLIWGRRVEQAQTLAVRLGKCGVRSEAVADLETAVRRADIVSCATLSPEPLVLGDWLAPGQHVDLVGSFTPQMREADDRTMQRAEIWVDTVDGALAESGELIHALQSGAIARESIRGDLFDLVRGHSPGRESADAITVFKSVGTALEDLAAANLIADSL